MDECVKGKIGGRVVKNTTRMIYKRCIFLRVNIKTTCFGRIWPSSGFMSIKILLYKLRELHCDVEIFHRIIVEIYFDNNSMGRSSHHNAIHAIYIVKS